MFWKRKRLPTRPEQESGVVVVVVRNQETETGESPENITWAENYFPMAAGYEWRYATTDINYLDSVRAENDREYVEL